MWCVLVAVDSWCGPADLGFQAAQRVVSSPPDMSLSVLRDITQNLPTMARSCLTSGSGSGSGVVYAAVVVVVLVV